ncbi:hypothetical protein [Streptomyces syringium]|uniref:hypothetical protein n=1 Tax=Streptomyces syringium TaxID=76729 RepID=UPI0037D0E117
MDLRALAGAGSRLVRAHEKLQAACLRVAASALTGERPSPEAAPALRQARDLVGRACDSVLVAYALIELRVGPPESRGLRAFEAYRDLADATDAAEDAQVALQRSGAETRLLGEAAGGMCAAVTLLASGLGPGIAAGAGHRTPVKLATRLRLIAEGAATGADRTRN